MSESVLFSGLTCAVWAVAATIAGRLLDWPLSATIVTSVLGSAVIGMLYAILWPAKRS